MSNEKASFGGPCPNQSVAPAMPEPMSGIIRLLDLYAEAAREYDEDSIGWPNVRSRMIHEVWAELSRLRAAQQEGARDTERLDWLDSQHETYTQWVDYECEHAFEWRRVDGLSLREAIDAERERITKAAEKAAARKAKRASRSVAPQSETREP